MGMNASDRSVFISARLLIADVCTTPSRVSSEIIGLILTEYNFMLILCCCSIDRKFCFTNILCYR